VSVTVLGLGLTPVAPAAVARAGSLTPVASAAPPTVDARPGPAPPAPGVARGRLQIVPELLTGRPPVALAGQHWRLRGTIVPYLPGQRVTVRLTRGRRLLRAWSVRVLPAPGGREGSFRLSVTVRVTGTVTVTAVHPATRTQASFAAAPRRVLVISGRVSPGSRGSSVHVLQQRLAALHYAVPTSGVFDAGTARAVLAYRKVNRLARNSSVDRRVFSWLMRGRGAFRVRYPGHGKHVEADLSRQVLAEITPGGRVRRVYVLSSGKPSTPTVVGHFRVYMREPGTNSHGMVDSSYFIGGYAIHGYAEVPTYAASHGCLRVPIPDAAAIFSWLRIGDRVDVYAHGRGGSRRVRGNAGP
jgi:peptidoglycan hydrolase-like protein with peptidoglycan-binding domain